MNIPMIRYILCQVMRIEGVLMLLPCLVSIIYGDGEGYYYGIVAAVLIISGFIGCQIPFRRSRLSMSRKAMP